MEERFPHPVWGPFRLGFAFPALLRGSLSIDINFYEWGDWFYPIKGKRSLSTFKLRRGVGVLFDFPAITSDKVRIARPFLILGTKVYSDGCSMVIGEAMVAGYP